MCHTRYGSDSYACKQPRNRMLWPRSWLCVRRHQYNRKKTFKLGHSYRWEPPIFNPHIVPYNGTANETATPLPLVRNDVKGESTAVLCLSAIRHGFTVGFFGSTRPHVLLEIKCNHSASFLSIAAGTSSCRGSSG